MWIRIHIHLGQWTRIQRYKVINYNFFFFSCRLLNWNQLNQDEIKFIYFSTFNLSKKSYIIYKTRNNNNWDTIYRIKYALNIISHLITASVLNFYTVWISPQKILCFLGHEVGLVQKEWILSERILNVEAARLIINII